MGEEMKTSEEMQTMLEELKAMKEGMKEAMNSGSTPQATKPEDLFSGWKKTTAPAVSAKVEKVLVPVEIGVKTGGNVTVYFQFPGELASEPTDLLAFVESMIDNEVPVKQWFQKGGGNNKFKR